MKINDKEWLEKEYKIRGLKSIAEECGCSMDTVSRRLRKFDIPVRNSTPINRFDNSGENNPNWKGGNFIKEGYRQVATPKGHPSKSRYIPEHRLVMEKHLGRYLSKEEVVHHKDGNKLNNDISNLELKSNQSEHAKEICEGQRIHDKIWNKEWMTEQYVVSNKSLQEIANKVGCTEGAVRNALKRLEIKKRDYTLSKIALEARKRGAKSGNRKSYIDFNCDPEWIKKEYLEKKRSFRSIGEELKWHKNKVKKYLTELGVELRSGKEQRTIFCESRKRS